jgi:outer membrane lipoprotein
LAKSPNLDKIISVVMKKYLYPLILFLTPFLLPGCVYVISKEVRREVAKDLNFREVTKAPDTYKGKVVLWGGMIIESKNLKEGTRVVVLQKDLDKWGRPKESHESQGRFIVLHPGYLDTAIYRRDREITVAGEITGQKVLPIDEIEYTYPVLSPREIHVWREPTKAEYPYRHYPWWRHYPYWLHPDWYPYRHYPRWRHYPYRPHHGWYPYRP